MSLLIGATPAFQIWEIKRKRIRAVFKGHTGRIRCIDFSPDGRFLASASYDHTVRMWLVRDGSSKRLSYPNAYDFNSIAFSPDGRYVAAGNDDKHLRIWNARTGHLLKIWKGHTDSVWFIAFRPDGKEMVSGGDDRTWKSWDLSSLQGSESRSSGYVANEEAIITCKGHAVRFLLVLFCHTF
jgi:glucose repression regulatory protein TUP1